MNRLQSELHRLYLLPVFGEAGGLIDGSGQVRAMVMELSSPADWELLSKVWRGVQLDLDWPAPAIAVSGSDALQLWFSLQQPVSAVRAAEVLAGLGARYLPGLAPATRLRLSPEAVGSSFGAALVPAEQEATGNWSAFVAPDLAPVFADTPWLDIPPGVEGQADLLARLESIKPDALATAMRQLQPSGLPAAPVMRTGGGDVDPRRFLQDVLNDETVALALRVEAAKALLQSDQDRR